MEDIFGLEKATRRSSMNILNNLLSDHFVLLTKTLNYHWNVTGPSFGAAHAFLEKIYKGLFEDIDEIAERIRMVGERPVGSLQGFLSHNRIKEHCEDQEIPDLTEMFIHLRNDFDSVIRQIRQDLETMEKENSKDIGTSNLLEDLLDKKEKVAWMIRAHLE